MGSGTLGLGPVAAEPGKGSFSPFLPVCTAAALTEQTRTGRVDALRMLLLSAPP